MAVVGIALGGTVLILRTLLVRDLGQQTSERLVQEAGEFSNAAQATTRDAAESPSAFAERVFRAYLSTNVTDSDESLLTFVDGSPFLSSAEPPADLLADDEWVDRNRIVVVSTFDDAATSNGQAHTLAVPLVVDGTPAGVFVASVWEAEGRERVDRAVRLAASIAAAAFLGAVALGWGVAGRVLRPLRDLAETSRTISDTDLTQRIAPGGHDEIGELIDTFNEMLDRLERSFATQRAFLDDAGHELRTPLTIVRGHVETSLTPDAWEASRPLVLAELDRMARIVDDLLVLARAEQPDFVRRRPVDLGDLVTTTAERGRALGPRRVVVDAAPLVVIDADPQRLEQALVNLVANAVRHTAEGGTIGVGARVVGADAEIWVRDDGEGIDPADHERIFQRFASASGQQRSGGAAGLGLSIVAAVAAGHHGRVTLASARGQGATFTIHLPGAVAGHRPE